MGIYVPLALVRRRAPHSPPGELQICREASVRRRLVQPGLGYLSTELLFLPAQARLWQRPSTRSGECVGAGDINANAFSPSLDMKRLKATRHLASFWTCLRSVGVANCDKAQILAGFASIPLLETMNPSSFPAGTPKTHFFGLIDMSHALRLSNVRRT